MSESARPTETAPEASSLPFGLVDLGMLGVALFWGVNFPIVKYALGDMLPMTFNGLRFVLSSAAMLIVTKLLAHDLRVDRRDWGRIIFTGLIGNTMYQVFFIQGLQRTTSGNSSLLISTHPIFIALLSAAFGLERVTSRMWAGILLSFAGITLVIATGANGISVGGETLAGDAMTLAAGVSWAVYTVLARPLLRKYPPIKIATLSMICGTPILVLASIPDLLAQDWGAISWRGWGGLGYSFFFSIALAYAIYYEAIKRLGNARTGIYVNLVPVIALVTAALTIGESIHPLQVLGAAVIFAGVYLTRSGGRR